MKKVDETEKEILEPEIKKNRKLTEKINNIEKEVFDAELNVLTMSLADIDKCICNLDAEDVDFTKKVLILTGMKKKKTSHCGSFQGPAISEQYVKHTLIVIELKDCIMQINWNLI